MNASSERSQIRTQFCACVKTLRFTRTVRVYTSARQTRRRESQAMPQADMFQQIRTQFERNPPLTFTKGHAKVLARNDEHFITELPEKWRVDYERRNGHHHTGFFAHNHLPYRTFGKLKHTDVYDLIADHLGVTITRHSKVGQPHPLPCYIQTWCYIHALLPIYLLSTFSLQAYHLSRLFHEHESSGDAYDPHHTDTLVSQLTTHPLALHHHQSCAQPTTNQSGHVSNASQTIFYKKGRRQIA